MKVCYVRTQRAEDVAASSIHTSIQVIVPDGLDYWQARDYIVGRIASEMTRYAVDEILNGLGVKHPHLG